MSVKENPDREKKKKNQVFVIVNWDELHARLQKDEEKDETHRTAFQKEPKEKSLLTVDLKNI